jgi:hypothetical protein
MCKLCMWQGTNMHNVHVIETTQKHKDQQSNCRWAKFWINISQKIYKWPTCTWKSAKHITK